MPNQIRADRLRGVELNTNEATTGSLEWDTSGVRKDVYPVRVATEDDYREVQVIVGRPASGISRYTFDSDEIESNTSIDVWSSNDGTINGATQATGIIGSDALSFNGSSDYVALPAFSNFSSFSISVWVNGSAGAAVGLTQNNNIEIREDGSGNWGFRMNSGTSLSGPGGNLDTDTHIVATWDGSTRELFINGQSQGTLSTTSNEQKGEGTAIGRRSNVDGFESYFNGVIDDPRIYDKRLNSTEVSNLYQNDTIADQ